MKKKYINPELVIVKIATHQQMLTMSNPDVLIDTTADAIDPGTVDSRENDFEDDEDFDFDEEEGF